ncbi:MAG: ATP-binding protein [Candidatus Bipolaricaulia bacterium]
MRKRFRFGNLSLRTKLISALILFTVLGAVSFGAITINRLSVRLENQVRDRGIALIDDLVVHFVQPTAQGDDFEFLINSIVGDDILYIQVVRYGGVLYEIRAANVQGQIPIEDPPSQMVVRRGKLQDGTWFFDIQRPLPDQLTEHPGLSYTATTMTVQVSRRPNYIRLGISLVLVQQELRAEMIRIVAVSLGFITVGVGIVLLLNRMILGPVGTLTETVRRFGSGELSTRAQVESGDEFETLAHEFNRMADSLEERDRHLEEINRKLARANRVKSEFLTMMGHELITPLHSIRGYSQLLLEGIDGPINETQRDDLRAILNAGDHLLDLIDNILRFSELEAGEERLHPGVLRVGQVVEEAIQSVSSLAREKGLELRTEVGLDRMTADGTKLKQILINLLDNAIKYTQAGTVTVRVERENGQVHFSVTDTGIGIPEEALPQLFEPFTQVDSSSTREVNGIGLGLAIVKRYVEMHGGEIQVESQLGEGSTFHVILPGAIDYGNGTGGEGAANT